MTAVNPALEAMPKAELHVHLDGCLRLDTMADLARASDITLPVPPERLADICVAPRECRNLAEVLSYFALPVALLQTADALERVTYELCEDAHREKVRYLEIRFAPTLHREGGMSLHEIVDAVVRSWRAGQRDFGLAGGVILCGLRHLTAGHTMAVARAGVPFLGNGVVGFDLAGDEAGFPVLLHREPLLWAREAGYGMTVHAGEGAGAGSVRDAVEQIGVSRIGHGVRSGQDGDLLQLLRREGITLDLCPTSNVQTKAVPDLAAHPAANFYRRGIQVTMNTDNRTVANTTLTHELSLGQEHMGLSLEDLAGMTLVALDAGFADQGERLALRRQFEAEMEALAIVPRMPGAGFGESNPAERA